MFTGTTHISACYMFLSSERNETIIKTGPKSQCVSWLTAQSSWSVASASLWSQPEQHHWAVASRSRSFQLLQVRCLSENCKSLLVRGLYGLQWMWVLLSLTKTVVQESAWVTRCLPWISEVQGKLQMDLLPWEQGGESRRAERERCGPF